MAQIPPQIEYSDKYYDDTYEYRHVILPKELAKKLITQTKKRELSEKEWRGIGITMSRGWIHYGYHDPEPHILLFRRAYSGPNPNLYGQEQQN